jgi:hypothetical protein
MPVDIERQLRAYGDVLDRVARETPRGNELARSWRPGRAGLAVAAMAVVVAVIGIAVSVAVDDSDGNDSGVAVEPRATTAVPEIVARIPWYAVRPLAVGGGDVWLVRGGEVYELGVSDPGVVVERRDPLSMQLKATINVAQPTVFAAAADEGQLYVAGGGDGGVPDTTVSAIDMQTNQVVWTRTLDDSSCSCPVVAGAGGVWLGGNGSDHVLRLDPTTGTLVAKIALPSPASTWAIEMVGERVAVGLQDGSVAVVDATRNRVTRAAGPRTESSRPVNVIAPARDTYDDPYVFFDDGRVGRVERDEIVMTDKRLKVAPTDAARAPDGTLWVVGGDRVIRVDDRDETFVYDESKDAFVATTDRLLFQRDGVPGLGQVVAVGDRLWIFESGPPNTFPPEPGILVARVPVG